MAAAATTTTTTTTTKRVTNCSWPDQTNAAAIISNAQVRWRWRKDAVWERSTHWRRAEPSTWPSSSWSRWRWAKPTWAAANRLPCQRATVCWSVWFTKCSKTSRAFTAKWATSTAISCCAGAGATCVTPWPKNCFSFRGGVGVGSDDNNNNNKTSTTAATVRIEERKRNASPGNHHNDHYSYLSAPDPYEYSFLSWLFWLFAVFFQRNAHDANMCCWTAAVCEMLCLNKSCFLYRYREEHGWRVDAMLFLFFKNNNNKKKHINK